jgi:hypothetical protein
MFDKGTHKKTLRLIVPDWTEEQINKNAERIAAKNTTIKKGPNVVHLDCFSGVLDEDDVKYINTELEAGLMELSRFDKSGIVFANLQDYSIPICYIISSPMVVSLLSGVGQNALWDAIKKVTLYTWKKVWRTKNINLTKNLNFGLRVNINKETTLELKMEGDFSEVTMLKSLDKVIKLIRDTQSRPQPQFSNFFVFDPDLEEWVEIDVMAEIRTKVREQAAARTDTTS